MKTNIEREVEYLTRNAIVEGDGNIHQVRVSLTRIQQETKRRVQEEIYEEIKDYQNHHTLTRGMDEYFSYLTTPDHE